jgi:hypothetical protein
MSYTVYEEDVIYDLKDYFDTNLDTYLTGIETDQGDGIDLPDIKKYDVGDKDVYALNMYPAGLLFPNEVDFEPHSVSADLLAMQIIFTVAIKGGKTENLTLKALRYAAAIRQCIDADRTAGGVVDRAAVSRVNFYARPPGIEDKMVIDIILETEKEIPR